jgi:hypothetical protein
MNKKLLVILGIVLSINFTGCSDPEDERYVVVPERKEKVSEDKEDTENKEDTVQVEDLSEEVEDEFEDDVEDDGGFIVSALDITGCDTFTQIVDKKLEKGMAYTNVKIGEEDVLVVTPKTFDDQNGHIASTGAALYIYKDGKPTFLGAIPGSGDTAYPLAVKDGILFMAGSSQVGKYTIKAGKFIHVKTVYVDYDEEGNEGYYTYEGEADSELLDDDSMLNEFYDEYEKAEVLNFDIIK